MSAERPLIGVLGGMGPLATVDFLHKLVQEMPARSDQEHVPVVAWNVPQIPDRQKALAGLGESPLPAMLDGLHHLLAAGATRIVMPCNTAHNWFDALAAECPVPFIHIVDATLEEVRQKVRPGAALGLIATKPMQASGMYQRRIEAEGFSCLALSERELDEWFTPGCYAVKGGDVAAGGVLLEKAADALVARGAACLLLACTEVPVALESVQSRHLPISIDTNRALARACVTYWQGAR